MEKNNKVENNTLYTRCPTCTTAFKVTEKLLNAAAGKVRCGACLAIFQATDYMLKPTERKNTPEPVTTKQAETSAKITETPDDSADTVADQPHNPQTHSEPKTETVPDTQSPEPSTKSEQYKSDQYKSDKYESEPQFESPSQATEPLDFETEPDFEDQSPTELDRDSIALPEHDDLAMTESAADPEIDIDVVTDVEQEDFSTQEDPLDVVIGSDEMDSHSEKISDFDYRGHSDEFDDEPAEFDQVVEQDSLASPLDSTLESKHHRERTEPSIDETDNIDLIESDLTSDSREILEATTEDSMLDVNESDLSLIDENQQYESPQQTDPPISIEEQDDFEVDDLSDQLAEQMQDTDAEPDPLDEFESIVEEKNTDLRRNIILAAVAILVFVGLQQVWSNRQALAWSESWGGTIKSVCQYLPCELKARRDVSKIRLLQRQLSPDEEDENQLDVKVLLTNEASFDQPYPTIKIAFSNKNGEQVSVKSFTPRDYLEPDSLNKLMPHGTEVHIHFKTELTHPDALGFEFIFE